MATYGAATKAARMTAVRDQIDAGSGPGKLEIGSAGMAAVLHTTTLNDPCGTVSGPVLTLSGFPKTTNASSTAGGATAAAARIRDSANNDVVTGLTVGLSNADVILDQVVIQNNQAVTISAASITHAA